MTDPKNPPATPAAQAQLPIDSLFAMLYCDLLAHTLNGAANQLRQVLGQSEACFATAAMFNGLAQVVEKHRTEIVSASMQRIQLAGPGDVPRLARTP